MLAATATSALAGSPALSARPQLSLRAVIYVRISKDPTGRRAGVERQLEDCRALAARLGVTLVVINGRDWLEDNDISAHGEDRKIRPGYQQLLRLIESGEIDLVLSWHPDRLHREPEELEPYRKLIRATGVVTHTVTAGLLDLASATGTFQARTTGAASAHMVEHMTEQVLRQKQAQAAAGLPLSGKRAFGYEPGGMEICEQEAELIRRAAADALAGRSLSAILRDWQASGIRSSMGKDWTIVTQVKDILLRPRTAGLMQHQGEIVGKAAWPAIISEQDQELLRRKLTDPRRKSSPGNKRRWLGAGVYLCGCQGCGAKIDVKGSNRAGAPTRYGCRVCHGVSKPAAALDQMVKDLIVGYLSSRELADLLPTGDAGELAALEAEAAEIRENLDALGAMLWAKQIDARQLAAFSAEGHARLEQLQERISAAYSGSPLESLAGHADPAQAFLELPISEQAAIVDELLEVKLLPSQGGGRLPKGQALRAELIAWRWR